MKKYIVIIAAILFATINLFAPNYKIESHLYIKERDSILIMKEKKESLLQVIRKYETFEPQPYYLFDAYYIGYGHRMDSYKRIQITKEQAERLLIEDFNRQCNYFKEIKNYDQRLLLAALSYNIGVGKVKKSRLYELAKKNSDMQTFIEYYLKFSNINGKKHELLLQRRKDEVYSVIYIRSFEIQ